MEDRRRWLLPLGLATVVLVVLANLGGPVGVGASGPALVVTVALAVYVAASLLFLLWADAPPGTTVALLLGMAAAATTAHHGDPGGTGGVGLYLGMAFAPLRLPLRLAVAVSVVGVVAFDVHLLLAADRPAVFVLVVTGGSALFFLLGLLLRSEHEQRSRADRLVDELRESREAERAAAALAERARLAREMHDVLAHTLSGLVLQLEGLSLRARRDGDPLAERLDAAHQLARSGLVEARDAVSALRGGPAPGPELLPSLVSAHRRAAASPCRLVVEGEPRAVNPDIGLAIYRTAQESLANARKHAPGAAVDVRLAWGPDTAGLCVADTGGPPHPRLHAAGSGLGLAGLAERAALLGGRLDAGPTGAGFRVALQLPAPREGS